MRYLTFAPETTRYPICIITRALREQELRDYVQGMEPEVVAYALSVSPKAKNDELKAFCLQLFPTLCRLQTDYLLVTDGALFKFLTKVPKVDAYGGYVLPCQLDGFKHFWIVYLPAPTQMIYKPELYQKLRQGLSALQLHRENKYMPPGIDVIQSEDYPTDVAAIAQYLTDLVRVPLTCDIETYDLKHYRAGIGTIAFAWNKHEGVAFAVDKDNSAEKSAQIRALLKKFFIARAKLGTRTLFHKGNFDINVLVYQLFMTDVLDTEGMLFGIETMLANFDDTLLITYLATNSCAGNRLSLKDQAQEFAGNYMVDVSDISKVDLSTLLTYNLVDVLATWFVYEKHYDTMVRDQQLEIYEELFKPCMADIIQMQLTGLPIDMEEVKRGKAEMQAIADQATNFIKSTPTLKRMEQLLNERWVTKRNSELKVKRVTLADAKEQFNFNSPLQIQALLHEIMKLPIHETTDTGQPATGKEAIEHLIPHAKSQEHIDILKALVAFKEVDKILTSFIPAFEDAYLAPDGWYYLFGFFNLGGTVSGRLSSSDPNMQNLPATGTKYAKIIKKMFKAPPGWLLVGLDFNSLEDRISALTTKDPNKLKVYTDGYDGHSLRAYAYFKKHMPDIDPDSVISINSIADTYKPWRQKSKAPTFALTYQGTWRTLMVNCGFSETEAKAIEAAYHEIYVVSDKWVQDRLQQAAKDGYVTVAFGLRLRTPMLKQSVLGSKRTPYEATAEGRTAGNAMGQSYGLLNSRAWMAFNRKLRASKYRLEIRPCAQIHDAGYALVRDHVDTLHWMNQTLVPEVQWQELPDIQHDEVKLGGELSVFYPTWADELMIPNGADQASILQLAQGHLSRG